MKKNDNFIFVFIKSVISWRPLSKATRANLSFVEVIHWLLELGVLPEHPDTITRNLSEKRMILLIVKKWQNFSYPPKTVKEIVDGLLMPKVNRHLVLATLLYFLLDLAKENEVDLVDNKGLFYKSTSLFLIQSKQFCKQ